ncbi:hypothetical protein BHM03_00049246 [Ensete ventricosum]|nr:hypothetical protein BHM03_00049246 [Ensete ventricosum]
MLPTSLRMREEEEGNMHQVLSMGSSDEQLGTRKDSASGSAMKGPTIRGRRTEGPECFVIQDVRLMCHLRVFSLEDCKPNRRSPLHLGALNPLLVGPIRMPKGPLNDHSKIPCIERGRKRQRTTHKDGGPGQAMYLRYLSHDHCYGKRCSLPW